MIPLKGPFATCLTTSPFSQTPIKLITLQNPLSVHKNFQKCTENDDQSSINTTQRFVCLGLQWDLQPCALKPSLTLRASRCQSTTVDGKITGSTGGNRIRQRFVIQFALKSTDEPVTTHDSHYSPEAQHRSLSSPQRFDHDMSRKPNCCVHGNVMSCSADLARSLIHRPCIAARRHLCTVSFTDFLHP